MKIVEIRRKLHSTSLSFLNKEFDLKDLNFTRQKFMKLFVYNKRHKTPSQTLLTKQSHFYFDNESEEASRMSVSMQIFTNEIESAIPTKMNNTPKSLTQFETWDKKIENKVEKDHTRNKFSIHKKNGKAKKKKNRKLFFP
jgi:hypothetical protein